MHAVVAALLALRASAPEGLEQRVDAAPPTVAIQWEGPPECGPRDELVARIEGLLGRPLGQPGDPELAVVGRVETDADGLRLVLEFTQPVARVRELRGATCGELRDAAAVVLAVTIDPLVPLEEPEPPPEPTPEPEPTIEPEPEPQAEPDPPPTLEPTPPRKDPIELRLRFAGGVQYRALPSVAGGPSLALGLRWRALRAELVGAWWLTRAGRFEQPEVGATISLGWVAARACGVPATTRVAFPLCAGIELGGVRAVPFGIAAARARTLPWIAAELGGAVSVALPGPLALWIGVDGVIPLVRPGFTIAGLGELHRVPAFALQSLVGLEIRFDAGRATDSRATGQGGGA